MEGAKTVEDILKGINLERFTDNFKQNDIDAATFLTLSKEEIQEVLPGKLGPQKKIMDEINRIRKIRNMNSGKPSSTVSTQQPPRLQPQTYAAGAKNDPVQRRKAITTGNRNTSVIELKDKKEETKKPVSKNSPRPPIAGQIAGGICIALVQRAIISKVTAPSVKKLLHGEETSTVSVTPQNVPETTQEVTDLSSDTSNIVEDKNVSSDPSNTFEGEMLTSDNTIKMDDLTQTSEQIDEFDCTSLPTSNDLYAPEDEEWPFECNNETFEFQGDTCDELTILDEESEDLLLNLASAVFGILDA